MDTDRFASIIENMQEGYYEIDLDGSFTFVNKAMCKIAKLPRERLIGLNYREYVTEETAKRLFEIFNRIYRTEEPGNVEYEVIRGDGSRTIVFNSASLLKDKTGKKMGFYGLVIDITSRKEMEENLRQSQERFEALFENANELIITTDENGFVARLNKKVEEMSGYSREELLGESILKIAYPEDRKEYIKFWKELLEGKRPIKELRAQTKDGKVSYLIASGSVIKKGDKILEIQYNAHDITYMKEARKTIDELRERLKSIIESSPNIIICLDRNAKIILVNPVCEKIFNRPQDSLVGRDFFSIDPSMERYRKYFEKVLEKNKSVILPEETLTNNSNKVFSINIYPLAVSDGVVGMVFTAVDVTDKKHMELQLLHAQKMETIGELSSGFAHDLNNILTGIVGNLNMLRLAQDNEKKEHYLDTLENITERARNLVHQILTFSKKHEGSPENLPVKKAIEEVVSIAAKSIPKNIELKYTDLPTNYSVYMDHTQLTQVLLNLIINARDAIGGKQGGKITINASKVHVDADSRRRYLLPSEGMFVKIDVTDNGCGITKDILPKIFDPFFTTKTRGPNKGTGLGLSMTYNIVKNVGGSIVVYSEQGVGTRFTILLPLSKGDEISLGGTSGRTKMHVKPKEKGKKILLVDDEDMIRDIGKEMLETLGYIVTTAENGRDCLEILKKNNNFDLVILDMIMPDLDGPHTLKEMERHNINIKVVISSGFSFEHEENVDLIENPMVVARLNKPFSMGELSSLVEEVLS